MRPIWLLPVVCLAIAQPVSAQGQDLPPFDDLIERYAAAHGLSADLVRAVIRHESGFDPHAVSAKGAKGLMQLMPSTARAMGVADPFEPEQNIRGGVLYLALLLQRYQKLELALAAYNAGPNSVDRYGDVPPFRETREYVKKVVATAGARHWPLEGPVIYRWVQMVNGEPRRHYSNIPPRDAAFAIVGRR